MSANPSVIEMVLPELTTTGVSGMEFTTVKTVSSMRAQFPICGRWHRRHMVRLTLAASSKGTMVIFAVRTHTNWAHHAEGAAVVEVVTPAIATGAIRHANVRRCLMEEANNFFFYFFYFKLNNLYSGAGEADWSLATQASSYTKINVSVGRHRNDQSRVELKKPGVTR